MRGRRPAARPAHERLHVVWPVVQRGRIEIGTVRPDERMDLGIEPDLPKESRIAERSEEFLPPARVRSRSSAPCRHRTRRAARRDRRSRSHERGRWGGSPLPWRPGPPCPLARAGRRPRPGGVRGSSRSGRRPPGPRRGMPRSCSPSGNPSRPPSPPPSFARNPGPGRGLPGRRRRRISIERGVVRVVWQAPYRQARS